MENRSQAAKEIMDEKLLLDTHNDEHWSENYEISVDELTAKADIDLSTLIIEAGVKRNCFEPFKA